MFTKKTYRDSRWVDNILRIGTPVILPPRFTIRGIREDEYEEWYEVKPYFLVRVKRPGEWKTVKYMRLDRGLEQATPHLVCKETRRSATMHVYRPETLFVQELGPITK